MYNDILTISCGVHSSIDSIPDYRIVYFNTEARASITGNIRTGFGNTADSTNTVAGITKFGFGKEVAVTVLGTMLVEVAPGQTIEVGTELGTDEVGRSTADGGTGIIAITKGSRYVTALLR